MGSPYRESGKLDALPEKKSFGLESVLTVTMESYCASRRQHRNDYKAVGVHGKLNISKDSIEVPYLTEAVVDYRAIALNHFEVYYSGTALIPK